jgi:hypothetical protein
MKDLLEFLIVLEELKEGFTNDNRSFCYRSMCSRNYLCRFWKYHTMSEIDKVKLVACIRECGNPELAEHAFEVINDMDSEIKRLAKVQERILTTIEEMQKAFPDHDIHGHRLYHERLIRSAFANESVRSAVKADMLTKMILFAVGAMALALGINIGFN